MLCKYYNSFFSLAFLLLFVYYFPHLSLHSMLVGPRVQVTSISELAIIIL